MSRWTFEPGHTEVRFRARHMMVAFVEGLFKDVHGWAEWAPGEPEGASCEATIDAAKLWTGVEARDQHLRSGDFLDVEHHRTITFRSTGLTQRSETEYELEGDLTVRGVTRPVALNVAYIGGWGTSFWESKGDEWRDFGPVRRVGFTATTRIDRRAWGVSWQDRLDRGGVVVSDHIALRIDVEALRDEDVARATRAAVAWKGAA